MAFDEVKAKRIIDLVAAQTIAARTNDIVDTMRVFGSLRGVAHAVFDSIGIELTKMLMEELRAWYSENPDEFILAEADLHKFPIRPAPGVLSPVWEEAINNIAEEKTVDADRLRDLFGNGAGLEDLLRNARMAEDGV